MLFKDIPIRRKLMLVMMLTSGAVLLLTCVSFFAYEFYTFRQSTVRQLSTLGEMLSANSTAALAFDSREDAAEILRALKAEKYIVAACLYNKDGALFSHYPEALIPADFPAKAGADGYQFSDAHLELYQPVIQGSRRLGTLYLKYDLVAMNERFHLYAIIVILVIAVSSLMAYALSRVLQKNISGPILALAETAKAISEHQDYAVRAIKQGRDETGLLTDAFNRMLEQIHEQNQTLSVFNQTLEQKVTERTTELEAVNKELESFSYSVSHDLRAPLRSIHGYSAILEEEYGGHLDKEGLKILDIIVSNTKKMGQLIDDLLAFSQLGRKELRKVDVSMNELVSSIWEEQKRAGNNEAIVYTQSNLPDACVDPHTISQVWVNLISNAIKYSHNKARPVITISAEQTDSEIIYCVKDNGAGFNMAYYDKLFGVFQRLHSIKEFEGTGVGLAIVQRIIARHGGRIWAEAEPDKGATFFFSIPIIHEQHV